MTYFEKVSKLTLETLLLNVRGNQEVLVVCDEDGFTSYGNEEQLRKNNPDWIKCQVSNIFVNDCNQLEVHITTED